MPSFLRTIFIRAKKTNTHSIQVKWYTVLVSDYIQQKGYNKDAYTFDSSQVEPFIFRSWSSRNEIKQKKHTRSIQVRWYRSYFVRYSIDRRYQNSIQVRFKSSGTVHISYFIQPKGDIKTAYTLDSRQVVPFIFQTISSQNEITQRNTHSIQVKWYTVHVSDYIKPKGGDKEEYTFDPSHVVYRSCFRLYPTDRR